MREQEASAAAAELCMRCTTASVKATDVEAAALPLLIVAVVVVNDPTNSSISGYDEEKEEEKNDESSKIVCKSVLILVLNIWFPRCTSCYSWFRTAKVELLTTAVDLAKAGGGPRSITASGLHLVGSSATVNMQRQHGCMQQQQQLLQQQQQPVPRIPPAGVKRRWAARPRCGVTAATTPVESSSEVSSSGGGGLGSDLMLSTPPHNMHYQPASPPESAALAVAEDTRQQLGWDDGENTGLITHSGRCSEDRPSTGKSLVHHHHLTAGHLVQPQSTLSANLVQFPSHETAVMPCISAVEGL